MISGQMKKFFVLFLTFGLLCTCHEQRAANHNPPHGHNLSMSSRPEIFIIILIIMVATFIIQHHSKIWEGIKQAGDYIEQKYKNYCVVKKVDIQKETIDAINYSLNNLNDQSKTIKQNTQIVISNVQNNQEILTLAGQKEELKKVGDDRDLSSSQKNDSFKECIEATPA
jgi:preprotein translocase subunit YajC